MKYISLFLLLLLLNACNLKKNYDKGDFPTYEVVIYDSIQVPVAENLILIDVNEKTNKILFLSRDTKTIVETDFKGNIQNSFIPIGDDESKCGKFLINLAYYNDTSIVAASERGYFFYKSDGTLQHSKTDKTEGYGALNYSISSIKYKENEYLLSLRRPTLDFEKFKDNFFSQKAIEATKFITCYDVKRDTIFNSFGYQKESIFLEGKYFYESPFVYFDILPNSNLFYIIHNPELKIYVYEVTDEIVLKKTIDIPCNNFELPALTPLGQQSDIYRLLSLNSQILSLFVTEKEIMISYDKGMSEGQYQQMQKGVIKQTEMPNLTTRYMIWLENDKKKAQDIELPKKVYDLKYFRNADYMIFNPNSTQVEPEGYEVFYVGKLIKK